MKKVRKAVWGLITAVIAWVLNVFAPRIAIDWQEWRAYRYSLWNTKRDNKLIKRALRRAYIKHRNDRKTYYILRDRFGGINELTKDQLDHFTRKGLFVKMSYMQRLHASIDIVTCNRAMAETFKKIRSVNEKERDEEKA